MIRAGEVNSGAPRLLIRPSSGGRAKPVEPVELVLREVVRIGDAEGDGMIERERIGLLWSEEIGYFVLDSDAQFKVFDHDGRFVRAVGRRGEGPGEFNVVTSVAVVGDQIVALDAGRRIWQFFDHDGEFVVQRNFGFPGASFVPVGGARVVVAGMDRRPDFVGTPLHLADLDEGMPSLHFGAVEPAKWKATDPWARAVVVGRASRPDVVWGGKAGIPTVRSGGPGARQHRRRQDPRRAPGRLRPRPAVPLGPSRMGCFRAQVV